MDNAEAIETLLADPELVRVSEELRALLRPAIALTVTPVDDEEEIALGASKIGGRPDLLAEQEWPTVAVNLPPPTPEFVAAAESLMADLPPADGVTPLSFIAQIHLPDVPQNGALPEHGVLLLFYTDVAFASDGDAGKPIHSTVAGRTWDYNIYLVSHKDSRACRVLYVPAESVEELARRDYPAALPKKRRYGGCTVAFSETFLFPDVETSVIGDSNDPRGVMVLTEEEWNVYSELTHSEYIPNVDHLLGYAQQGQPYALEASYKNFRTTLFPELPEWGTLTPAEQQAELLGARLLLQIEPHENGMWFGRAGALYFFIRDVDLAARDFSRVWAWIQ